MTDDHDPTHPVPVEPAVPATGPPAPNAEEIARLLDRTRLGPQSRRAVQLVMAGGCSQSAAARAVERSRQHVSQAMKVVRRAVVDGGVCPCCGWNRSTRQQPGE